MTSDHRPPCDGGLFGGIFGRGAVDTGDEAWLQAMLDVEAALARVLERVGLAPTGAGAAVTAAAQAADFDTGELGRQAAKTGNPVMALVRELTRMLPRPAAGVVHLGATSQDILDTAAMLLARRASTVLNTDLSAAAHGAAMLAERHRDTLMIGRTLLQQALPVTFGLTAAGWLTGLDEARSALRRIAADRLAVQFGGAVGTLASLDDQGPHVAELLAEELGLAAPIMPWHTQRLRLIELAGALAGTAAVLGKIARDVTLLAQGEVGEVREAGGPGRGGSSTMPHKRNPVASIAILGCTRRVPALAATLTAAAEQEHQRAAGGWHAEWEPCGEMFRLTGSAASWAAELLAGLEVDTARMRANLDATGGLPLAEHVATLLAPALGRLAAHELVEEACLQAVSTGGSLREVLVGTRQGAVARRLTEAGVTAAQIDAALDPSGYLGAAGYFVDRAVAAHRAQVSP